MSSPSTRGGRAPARGPPPIQVHSRPPSAGESAATRPPSEARQPRALRRTGRRFANATIRRGRFFPPFGAVELIEMLVPGRRVDNRADGGSCAPISGREHEGVRADDVESLLGGTSTRRLISFPVDLRRWLAEASARRGD